MNEVELCFTSAIELAQALRRKDVSAREVMAAHLSQIERVNPQVNAIVTLDPDRAMAGAMAADEALVLGQTVGPLHGLPIAIKDLVDTADMRTTYGSPIYANHVPVADALIVERLRRAGAIVIGKTNTPEFGAGSQTFNEVFGATRNPFDLSKTCGGSSGGAAAALACGMIPIADGSDMGGSLRNPANFCNVVGFRVSPGRVPSYPRPLAWFPLSVSGPMARTVADTAYLLAAMAGPDPRSPIAIQESGDRFAGPLERDFSGVRVAWSHDLGGLPVDRRVTAVVEAQRTVFAGLGCEVESAVPDFGQADEIFKVLRAWSFAATLGPTLAQHRAMLKDTLVWNIESGLVLTGQQVADAELARTLLYQQVRVFMESYDFMIFPVSQMPPFDVNVPYVTEIEGVVMETYIDWMKACYFISVLGLPAISVPCGFTQEGLPVGLQIVGRHHDELGVLQLAYAFEQISQLWRRRPPLVAS